MPKLFCIGEALIDFIPMDIDTELKNVSGFLKKPGGAPANVSAAAARLGNDAAFLGKLGKDAFGDFLVETISASGVDTSCILRTDKANTSLAFVSLKNDGNREFSFYRKPGADMLLESSEIQDDWFNEGDILQFCTVSLSAEPVRSAHIKAIEAVKKKNGVIVFDPNLRFPLWDDKDALKKTCLEFLSYSDVVKISDEELEFITGTTDEKEAAEILFEKGVKVFVYTMGKNGAKLFTPDFSVYSEGFSIKAIDTTGAGDSFLGGFLGKLMLDGQSIYNIKSDYAKTLLQFSNACGAIVSSRKGAIGSMPDKKEVEKFLREHNC